MKNLLVKSKLIVKHEAFWWIFAAVFSATIAVVSPDSVYAQITNTFILTGFLSIVFVGVNVTYNIFQTRNFDFSMFTMPAEVSALMGKFLFCLLVLSTLDVIAKIVTHHPWM